MNFDELPEFTKDVKRLTKKWRSIPKDIEAAKKYILPLYEQLAPDVDVAEYRREFFAGRTAQILYTNDTTEVVKMRLDVEYLGRSDKVRVIFVAVISKKTITFVELYAKNDKSREDPSRFKNFIN